MTSITVRFPRRLLQARMARRMPVSGTSRKRRLTHLTAAQGPEADCGKPTDARSCVHAPAAGSRPLRAIARRYLARPISRR